MGNPARPKDMSDTVRLTGQATRATSGRRVIRRTSSRTTVPNGNERSFTPSPYDAVSRLFTLARPRPVPSPLGHARLEHALERLARDAAAVVAHGQAQRPAPHARAHDQVQRPLGLAVLHRVLDERLHEVRRQAHGPRVGRHVERHLELRPEARLLQVEVALHVPQLVVERDELVRPRELRAHVVRERQHQPARAIRVGPHERGDRVQRVEDEVRLHLREQRGRGRGRELRELQLRRELVAQHLEQLDRRLVERRAARRVGDDRARRPVRHPQRHDRRRAQRARLVTGTRSGGRAARAAARSSASASKTGRIGASPAPW